MIRIAFCDDDLSVLQELGTLFDQYSAQRRQAIDHVAFHSPLDLLARIERGARFDILFLDVLMPGESGMHTAKEIRKYDTNIKIIFLTSSAEFAVESYAVGAYYYQLKPVCPDKLFTLLDAVIATCKKEQTNSLILRCKSGIARVDLPHLEYCEVIHRTLFIHLADGNTLESVGSLDDLFRQLEPYGGFLRPHRSYLVNLDHVRQISYKAIAMGSGVQIPIPRGKYHEIKDAYLERAFQYGKVPL